MSIAALPLLTMGLTSPFISADSLAPSATNAAVLGDHVALVEEDIVLERAKMINTFFSERSMPLAGFGVKMVEESEKNGLDWRLIPAIAARESSGGKQACGYNPFGWASCKVNFKSYHEAIEVIAKNLGGNNPKTADYYEGASTEKILHHYNGTVMPAYTGEVLAIMNMIGPKDSTTN